jgi:signal transduction histidine kinase/DNA-binding response OmpR family regulator
MGARMRALDWSKTPLGPVETWPNSLRVVIRIMLTSRYAMWMGWGPDLTFFCNDAYRPTLGLKHQWALGASARRVWAEIWSDIGPRAETVLRTGSATWDEGLLLFLERRGFSEETYHTFSYSPVPDDAGGVGGMLCVVTEDTERTIGERRLRALRELSTSTVGAKDPEAACELAVRSLSANSHDLPFVLIYLIGPEDQGAGGPINAHAHLVARTGIDGPPALLPATIALHPRSGGHEAAAPSWPLSEVYASHAAVTVWDVERRFGRVHAGPWPESIQTTMVLPLGAPGQKGRLTGFFVTGLSPRRPLDDNYRGFLDLVAGQVARAISDARASEEQRLRAEQLAELDRAKTTFFSNVSHELRTPLTLMLGPVEDATRSAGRSLSGESLELVHRNTVRLLKLVNVLLDFSRIEAGRMQAAYVPTDLAELTRELASAFRAAIERAGIRFEVDCPPLEGPVAVDRDMWEKILLNLLSNALKFTFEGRIRVSLRDDAGGDGVELTVEDSGTGIPADELPHLFERFHRVVGARARTHEGSGIGLALVHELTRLHGGAVRVSSTVGEGTTFTIAMPRRQPKVASSAASAPTGAGGAPSVPPSPQPSGSPSPAPGPEAYVLEAERWVSDDDDVDGGDAGPRGWGFPTRKAPAAAEARILLADDNADMRDYLGRLLRARWTVEAVADGQAALASALARRPDLVLTDVMMPNLDGFGLLRALREEPTTRDVPVIMLSARAGEESRVEGLEAGADDYLVKPFSARELMARVVTHLQIARLRASAEEERQKLSDVLMQAPVAVALFSGPEHRYSLANARYGEMVGRPTLVGRTVRQAFPELGEHQVIANLDQVFHTGKPLFVTEIDVPIRRAGQGDDVPQSRYFNYSAQPLRDKGEVAGVIVVATEVTEQVLARRRVDALRTAAEQANRAKDEFMAMLGHELRNPLAPILTALHLMRLRAGGVAERERTVIERQVNHLTRLVDDLLDVSRITRGKVQLHRKPIEIAEVVAKAIEMASPLLEQRRHHLEVSVPPRGLVVNADLTRLSQVVANLLTNAAKYTDPGGNIVIEAAREGREARDGALGGAQVVLRVRDDGIGIAGEMLPHVFETFVQERQAIDRSQGGLGLGLAIVKSLTALHGGQVEAHSAGVGRGSEFTLRLPSEHAAPAPAWLPGSAAEVSIPRARRDGLRILVVDDNEDAATLLADALDLLGHETRIAHDSPRAIHAVKDFTPDVAFLDIGLPVMDGYELGRRLREEAGLEKLRLVAVSGYGQESDLRRSQEAGFQDHLVKPVAQSKLESVLASLGGPPPGPALNGAAS